MFLPFCNNSLSWLYFFIVLIFSGVLTIQYYRDILPTQSFRLGHNDSQTRMVTTMKTNKTSLSEISEEIKNTDLVYLKEPQLLTSKCWKNHCEKAVDGRMVFFIKSAIFRGNIREFIRRTWGQLNHIQGFQLSTIFVVGRAENEKLQSLLDEEYDRYKDILQLNISDDYSFIAQKTLGGMKWASENLDGSYFYSSGDDDVLVDLAELVKAFKWHKQLNSKGWPYYPILCLLGSRIGDAPNRVASSKYYTSNKDHKWPFFPDFCLGGAYATTIEVASLLWKASKGETPMKMDDVWITGVLRGKIGMPRQYIRWFSPPIAKHYWGFKEAAGQNRREFMQGEWARVIKKYRSLSACWCS